MTFWVYFFTWVASMVAGELLRPKIQVDNAKPAGKSDFELPTATEDRRLPYVFGTVQLKAPNVTWWGDLGNQPIKKKAGKGGFMGTGRTIWQTVGYRYYAGMMLALCAGPVELLEIRADDKVVWSGVSTGGTITVDNEGIFGGEDSRGGVAALVNFLPGNAAHATDSYLAGQLGSPLPAWRGTASLIWYGPSVTFTRMVTDGYSFPGWPVTVQSGYLGTSVRIAPISAVVRRLPSSLGLASSITNLGGDANAAEVIYEVLTNPDCGMSQPAALIDTASFQAAAQQLAAESFGISGMWDDDSSARDFIDGVLRTIDGACYLDFATGKWRLVLARGGYDIATLPVLDQTSISALEGYSEVALDESTNQVQLTYTSRTAGFTERTVQAQAFANIRYQDAVVNQRLSYPMISKKDLAARVADRDLRGLSTSLAKGDLICNRKARTLKPGDVFVLQWPPIGLDQVVCRVLRVSRGDLKSGAVRISFLKDVFSLGTALYDAPAPSGWVDPVQVPAPCPAQLVIEAPYHLTRQDAAKLLIMGQRPNSSCQAYEVWVKKTAPVAEGNYSYRGTGLAFAPVGALTQAYGQTAVVDESGALIVSGGADLAALATVFDSELRMGANLARFESGEEVVIRQITNNGNGTWTLTGVWRGVLDSVPQAHAVGERLWFSSYGQATTDETWAVGDALKARLLPSGFRGVLPIASASDALLTIAGRAAKPYPPALLRVQGQASLSTSLGDLAWTWRHRNRLTQVGIIPQDDPSAATPEGDYTLRIMVGIPGTSYVYATTLDPGAFQIVGPDPGCPATIQLNTGLISAGSTVHVYVQLSTATIWYTVNTQPIPGDAIALWNVPVVAITIGGVAAVGPGTPVDVRALTQTTLTAQTGQAYTLTAAQRIATSTNGLLPASIGIKGVSGAVASAELQPSLTTMTGLGMTLGQYLGGIQS